MDDAQDTRSPTKKAMDERKRLLEELSGGRRPAAQQPPQQAPRPQFQAALPPEPKPQPPMPKGDSSLEWMLAKGRVHQPTLTDMQRAAYEKQMAQGLTGRGPQPHGLPVFGAHSKPPVPAMPRPPVQRAPASPAPKPAAMPAIMPGKPADQLLPVQAQQQQRQEGFPMVQSAPRMLQPGDPSMDPYGAGMEHALRVDNARRAQEADMMRDQMRMAHEREMAGMAQAADRERLAAQQASQQDELERRDARNARLMEMAGFGPIIRNGKRVNPLALLRSSLLG